MVLWIEKKWIDLLSPRLKRFKWKDSKTANFRCPICGDSEKDARKARAYFIEHEGKYFMKCHNCGISMSFSNFLKTEFPDQYPEYQVDVLQQKRGTKKKTVVVDDLSAARTDTEKKLSSLNILSNKWQYLSDMDSDDYPVRYMTSRHVPESALHEMIYTDDFCKWVIDNSGLKKYEKRLPHDKRIIFPLIDEHERLLGAQGRVIGDCNKKTLRYITIKFNDTYSKLYGLHNVDLNSSDPIYVVEGPVDSLFLPNAIALCGGDISMSLAKYPKHKMIIVLDNEPRNKDTIERIKDAIDQGYKVAIWREIPSNLKDINDMVSKGKMPISEVISIINNNTLQGMAAKMALSSWKKI